LFTKFETIFKDASSTDTDKLADTFLEILKVSVESMDTDPKLASNLLYQTAEWT